ncbi:hypothetical protein ACP4OV_023544 [Aristida adscensionis]
MDCDGDGDAAPLDPSLAPVLLFRRGRGGADEPEDAAANDGGARPVYSGWTTSSMPQGWVLTLDAATRAASLRDPFTSRTVRLPPDPDGLLASSKTTRCFLSTPRPADPGCVVLVLHRTAPVLCYCRPGDTDTRWLRHEYRPELLDGDDSYARDGITKPVITKLTAVRGAFYTQRSDKLVTVQFSPEPTLSASQVMDKPSETSSYLLTRSYLVESCGELFTVCFCYTKLCVHRVLRVEVQKLDWSRSTWVKVTGLGDRAFFVIRRQFAVSMAAEEFGLKPNCVYFINADDKGLYFYDMEQGTTTLHNPGQSIPHSVQPILLIPAAI